MRLFKTRKEKDHPFVESSTFADVYNKKMYGDKGKVDPYLDLFNENADSVNTDAHWHFADKPFFDGITEDQANDPQIEELNVIVGLKRLQENLMGLPLTNSTSYRLRCYIHYVGDIHQPLHSVSRFTEKQPNGDYGGNGFWIS